VGTVIYLSVHKAIPVVTGLEYLMPEELLSPEELPEREPQFS
jgi:hypothetical protein